MGNRILSHGNKADRDICLRNGMWYVRLCNPITFQHGNFEIDFGGVGINKDHVKVSYDRTGNILIGMNVLS